MEFDYDKWADVYDLVYSYVKDDIKFFIEESKASNGEILELGSGTGRVTRRWINFARYSDRTGCIGKGRILDCKLAKEGLYLHMTLDGEEFLGMLHPVTDEEEE